MKGNVIQMNTLHLNSVRLNGIGKVQSVSLKGGSTEDPVFPPVEPPIEPEPTPTYTLSASVTNGKVSAKRNGSAVSLPYTANEGDTIVLEVTPNDGYAFEGWNDGNADNPRSITMNADVALSAQCVEVVQPPVGNYIQFEDKAVEAICVANWSSDGIGLTEEDAAKVTTIGSAFSQNKEITSFDEFRYFTGVTSIRADWDNSTSAYKGAFAGCSNLKTISLPNSLVKLGPFSFYNCTSLSVDITDMLLNLTSIGEYAFYKCPITGKVVMPNITWLGRAVFYQSNVTEVSDIGGATKLLGAQTGAFYKCNLLESVTLPSTMTSIEGGALYYCENLKRIISRASVPPTIESWSFNGAIIEVIYVPDASLEAYKTATNWNQYADRIHPLSEIEDYYVSDALLMHLDGINKGGVDGEWRDLVGNNHFHAKADTPMPISLDNGWEFNGVDTMMTCDDGNKLSWSPTSTDGIRTMEVVVEFTGTEDKSCCFTMGSAGFAFGRTSSKYILGASGAKAAMVNGSGLVPRKCVFTYIGNGVAYENGVLLSSASSDYWSAGWTLGSADNGRYFKGKIHSIRIHDRILSEEEILYNQRIDNKRFNLGLDI